MRERTKSTGLYPNWVLASNLHRSFQGPKLVEREGAASLGISYGDTRTRVERLAGGPEISVGTKCRTVGRCRGRDSEVAVAAQPQNDINRVASFW